MVIFLDVDGVLNRKQDWVCKYTVYEPCIKALAEIAKKIGCTEIVLSSTWRACAGEKEPNFYVNLKCKLWKYGLAIVGTTPVSKHTREEEILYYTKRYECGKYLILDDDSSLFTLGVDIPLYVCNYKTGLTHTDINKAYRTWKKYWY